MRTLLYSFIFLSTLFSQEKTRFSTHPIPMFRSSEQAQRCYRILRLIDKIFQNHNLEYFARGGTLLGTMRHGGFIPWDHDVDIAVPIDKYEQLFTLLSEFEKYNLFIDQSKRHTYRLAIRDSYDPYGAYCDVCFYWIERDYLGRKRAFFGDKWMRYATTAILFFNEIYPIQRRKFGNFTINTPNNPIPYLNSHYGKEWKTTALTKESFNGNTHRFKIYDFSPIPDENFHLEEDDLK